MGLRHTLSELGVAPHLLPFAFFLRTLLLAGHGKCSDGRVLGVVTAQGTAGGRADPEGEPPPLPHSSIGGCQSFGARRHRCCVSLLCPTGFPPSGKGRGQGAMGWRRTMSSSWLTPGCCELCGSGGTGPAMCQEGWAQPAQHTCSSKLPPVPPCMPEGNYNPRDILVKPAQF